MRAIVETVNFLRFRSVAEVGCREWAAGRQTSELVYQELTLSTTLHWS